MRKTKYVILGLSIIIVFSMIIISSKMMTVDTEPSKKKNHTSALLYDVEIDELTSNDWAWAISQGYCTGSGTENDPYLFDNHVFQYNAGSGHSIAIKNSRKYFKFEDCFIQESKPGCSGIYLFNTTNGQFEMCIIENNSIGILIEECNLSTFIFNKWNTVRENSNGVIINNSNYVFFNGIADDSYLYTLSVYDNDNYGILLKNSNCNSFIHISLNYNSQSGIYLNHSNLNLIEECHFLNNEGDGITVFLSDNNTIDNCKIQQNLGNGISLISSNFNKVIDNDDIEFNAGIAISLNSSSYNLITRNSGYCYITLFAIFMVDSHYNQITENNLMINPEGGLSLVSCSYNDILNNRFSSSESGVYLFSSSFNKIYSNVVSGRNGIYLHMSTDNEIVKNIANGNTEAGIKLSFSQNNQILRNSASHNNFGIYLNRSDDNYVIANYLPRNNQCIMEVACRNNLIHDNQCYEEPSDIIPIVFYSILGPSLAVNIALLILIFKKRRK